MRIPQIYCMMNSGKPLTDEVRQVLLINACDMAEAGNEFQKVKGRRYEGVIKSDLESLSYAGLTELRRPAWETHISVIRDEKSPNEAAWMKYEGEAIEFSYVPNLEFNGIYVWLPVVCERALDIREELGLSRNPFYNLHMTIGNRKEELNLNGEIE